MKEGSVYRGNLEPEVAVATLLRVTHHRMQIDANIAQLLASCTVHAKTRNLLVCEGSHGYVVINRKNVKLYSAKDKRELLAESDLERHQLAVWLGVVWATKWS